MSSSSLSEIVIISGGQTGADRAALDFAIEHGFAHGGWCPRGRLAEDGPIDGRYQLQETPSPRYAQRTEWNVRDSDATAVFTISKSTSGGTALTIGFAERLGKPYLHLARDAGDSIPECARRLAEFLKLQHVHRLNVAGPRASQEPEIGGFVHAVFAAALSEELPS